MVELNISYLSERERKANERKMAKSLSQKSAVFVQCERVYLCIQKLCISKSRWHLFFALLYALRCFGSCGLIILPLYFVYRKILSPNSFFLSYILFPFYFRSTYILILSDAMSCSGKSSNNWTLMQQHITETKLNTLSQRIVCVRVLCERLTMVLRNATSISQEPTITTTEIHWVLRSFFHYHLPLSLNHKH